MFGMSAGNETFWRSNILRQGDISGQEMFLWNSAQEQRPE
jgi:hypothetical protein